jgi:hypothetical protein
MGTLVFYSGVKMFIICLYASLTVIRVIKLGKCRSFSVDLEGRNAYKIVS